MKRTIDTQPEVRNIALAGTYGTGKSSILRQVATVYDGRVVELSLLTLGVQPEIVMPGGDTNPAATSTTNRIQKEIVKQLLYQQRPAKAPASRFRRIGRFRWGHELWIAGVAGAIAVALGMVIGLDVVVSPSLAVTVSERPHVFAVIGLFLVVALIAGGVTVLARALARGRLGIERVTAGPATITLPPRSVSYFDEYLDEIIYFFETNRKRDIVIIEDLDRFNDPNIFEALRSLNGLLNAAQQLGGRRIRFIYAVRDSVFEKLGQDLTIARTDEARAELARANRTKFFELVIPVVPFITHKNARDLMSDLLDKRGHKISKDLVDLAARHLADMRLVHNALNEYEVFKHRLLDVETPVPELDPDRLFAMILFKNAHMGDFEKIRHAESSLDRLWETWRELVRTNIASLRAENRDLRRRIARRTAAAEHAKDIGQRLRERIDALAGAPGTGLATSEIRHKGAKVPDAKLQSAGFWETFLDEDLPLTVEAHPPGRGYGTQSMQLGREVIEVLIDRSLNAADFVEDSAAEAERTIERNEAEIEFLQRHTWKQLAADSRFTYSQHLLQKRVSFRAWAQEILPSRLAVDLVVNGYITSYFALHVSSFYGKLIRPDAMTYVMRFIDHGVAEPDYPLDGDDVDAILWDQGSAVLVERSMFNIGILDHLLSSRPDEAATVASSIANSDSVGLEFIDRYLESGGQKQALVARLAPLMKDIYVHLVSTPTLSLPERVVLMDTAISNRRNEVRYHRSPELRTFIEANYRELPGLAPDAAPEDAANVVRFVSYIDAVVPSLAGLTQEAVAEFKTTRSYALTRENLELIATPSDISLDQLAAASSVAFDYAVTLASDYARALLESGDTRYSVTSPAMLIKFLVAVGDADSAAVETVLAHAEPNCRLSDLSEVPSDTWPAVARSERAPMTFANVAAYIEEYGEVDDDLGHSLSSAAAITEWADADPAERAQMALAILNSTARELDASQRVKLAQSLEPGVLEAAQIAPRPGELVGNLIAAELIHDDENAFSSRLMVDWQTQSHAMAHSENFVALISPDTLDVRFIAPLLRDDSHPTLHLPVARAFQQYPTIPRDAYEAYADRALAGGFLPSASGINAARAGGISAEKTIALLARFMERISSDELRGILRTLGRPWSKVADPGFGVTPITDSADARTILNALQLAGVVSKFPLQDGKLRVSLRQK
ncbi:hypothetical protein JNB62_06465 [Microbacterium jejuense]|uniref:YobI-like P-loop NTPase domain-containing protein n=1 Tax=Microbacterium jejuense TaxID=1263637 RepID=A0ABS7HKQ4_9MICO|nr:hypothetical protein [Microbacterium jejuense]MBW9093320.1 hypothetical protein [Microbacterium jejuense]